MDSNETEQKKYIWMKNFSTTIKVRISIWNVTALEGRIILYVCIYEVCETYFAFVIRGKDILYTILRPTYIIHHTLWNV